MVIYLASGLGFSPEYRDYKQRITNHLELNSHQVLDPWSHPSLDGDLGAAAEIQDTNERRSEFRRIAKAIGAGNERMIRSADAILAVLDGLEIDSGVAGEVGMAFALGKPCYGLRTDVRLSGEFEGLPFNLQILYFIEASGGSVVNEINHLNLIQEKVVPC